MTNCEKKKRLDCGLLNCFVIFWIEYLVLIYVNNKFCNNRDCSSVVLTFPGPFTVCVIL